MNWAYFFAYAFHGGTFMQLNIKKGLVHLIVAIAGISSPAAQLSSYCWMSDNGSDIGGKNIDERMPIASVSKLFTSLMAATTFDLNYKFYTQVYVTPVSKGVFDVHLQGTGDPYFNKFKMHMIISKLNEIKVTKIRNLTFDENVKYLHETDLSSGFRVGKEIIQPLILKEEMDFPQPPIVAAQLTQIPFILKTYSASFKLADATGIQLFKNPAFQVSKVSYLPSSQFKLTKQTEKLFIASQNLKTMLKAMNWNSNNHAANRIFMAAGGISKFYKLYYGDFQQTETDVKFVNGSGQNHDLTGNGRLYNEASCRATIRTVRQLKKAVEAQKTDLSDIMSVVGIDIGSTVGGAVYSNSLTKGAVIAKTGTIGTNVTLAGIANTKKGLKYFMFNAALGNPSSRVKNKRAWLAQEDDRGRRLISIELQKFMKSNGGPVAFKYERQAPLKDNLENYDETDISQSLGLLSQPTE